MDWLEPLVKHLADLGGWGPVLFVGIYILAAITLAPAFLLTFSAGAVFGLWRGTLLTYVGAVLGASAVYAVAAPLARSRVLRWIDRDPRVSATRRAVVRDSARIMYTADRRALENDEIFVEFITGEHDAFVVEDADYLLQPRTEGNLDLHRFLMVADGVVRAQGRKLLFTTNLPNVGAIDEALQRPGRCFATMVIRPLNAAEVERLASRLTGGDEDISRRVVGRALPNGNRAATLAGVYRAYNVEKLS